MYLYTSHGSSGSKHTCDETRWYFTDVEVPTLENPVTYAVNVTTHGCDAIPGVVSADIIGRVAVMNWVGNKEHDFRYYIVKIPKRLLIGFLADIQSDHIMFTAGDYSAIEVDVDSPAYYRGFYPTQEYEKKNYSEYLRSR